MPEKNKVGEKVAEIRKSRKISPEDLAERAQLSLIQVQQIEEGALLPSLTPLIKISRVLGVRLGTFLDDADNIGPVITRKDGAGNVVRFAGKTDAPKSSLDFYSLAADKTGRHMEPFLIDIQSASNVAPALSSHEGEEFIYVLSGDVEILYGTDVHALSAGDSIYYDSIVMHHVHAKGSAPARILAVVYAPY